MKQPWVTIFSLAQSRLVIRNIWDQRWQQSKGLWSRYLLMIAFPFILNFGIHNPFIQLRSKLLESWSVCVLAHTASGLVFTHHKVAKKIITSNQPAICLVHTIIFLNRTLSDHSLCARHCPGGLNAWVIQSSQWSCGVAIISHMNKPETMLRLKEDNTPKATPSVTSPCPLCQHS